MAEEEEESYNEKGKWEGKCMVEIGGIGAEQVWSAAIQDFCNLHKWIPIDTCYRVEGIEGQPGLIRYCAATVKDDHNNPVIKWAKEKLLTIDPIQRSLSYEIGDNNFGFKSYVATLKVIPINSSGDDDAAGCKIQWGFVSDPMEAWTFQGLKSYIDHCLQFMANKIHSLPLIDA